MTKEEFMFDHDYDMVVDLINREIEIRNPKENEKRFEKSSSNKARDFFKM